MFFEIARNAKAARYLESWRFFCCHIKLHNDFLYLPTFISTLVMTRQVTLDAPLTYAIHTERKTEKNVVLQSNGYGSDAAEGNGWLPIATAPRFLFALPVFHAHALNRVHLRCKTSHSKHTYPTIIATHIHSTAEQYTINSI